MASTAATCHAHAAWHAARWRNPRGRLGALQSSADIDAQCETGPLTWGRPGVKRRVRAAAAVVPRGCCEGAAQDAGYMSKEAMTAGSAAHRRGVLLASLALAAVPPAIAEDVALPGGIATQDEADRAVPGGTMEDDGAVAGGTPEVTQKVFFEVAIDGEPVGRIVVGLYGKDAPVGAARFSELAAGKQGVSYRRKEFIKILPDKLIQNAGLRGFSLTGGARDVVPFTGGETSVALLNEKEALSKRPGGALKHKNGSVSLVVYDPTIPPPKTKLIAKGGQLINVEESSSRTQPNGTAFTISLIDFPQLDETNLVVGEILDGADVVDRISQVPAVKENTNSPYFVAAKIIGDSRAVVAERGFNRPYAKIVITKCGLLNS